MKYANLHCIPFIISACCHIGEYHKGDRLGEGYTKDYQRRLLNRGDKVIVHSNAEGDYLVEKGIDKEKVFFWPHGIEPGELEGGDGGRFRKKYNLTGPVVFQLSVQAHDKGSPCLVEAMKILWKRGINCNLVLAGAVHEDFRGHIKSLKDEKRCLILGPVSEEEKRDLLACGDVMVMASRTDSFGIVYLEAWSYGKPVIGARAGGVPEVIRDGVDGYLVPFGNPEQLSGRILNLIENERLRNEMGESGRAKVLKDYTWEKVYQKMKSLYQKLVHKWK
jgi:glycosyltransferase involved in cell wall biosynthesis